MADGASSAVRRGPGWGMALAVVMALALLVTLGMWQVKRLQWKEGLLADLARAEAVADADLPAYHDIADLDALRPPVRLRADGVYAGLALALAPRTWQGQPGYHMIAPLRLDGGGILMVNRGWVGWSDHDKTAVPDGRVRVTGLLRRVERANPFIPANDPAAGQWFRMDPAAMAASSLAGQAPTVAVYVLYADGEKIDGVEADDAPERAALHWAPPNNHLGYALFWFSMAGVLLAMCGVGLWRRGR